MKQNGDKAIQEVQCMAKTILDGKYASLFTAIVNEIYLLEMQEIDPV